MKPLEVGNLTTINWRYNNPRGSYVEEEHWRIKDTSVQRIKLPHGWLVSMSVDGTTFVPFADNGTGWGKDDDAKLRLDEAKVMDKWG